jgi:hypothetical protein
VNRWVLRGSVVVDLIAATAAGRARAAPAVDARARSVAITVQTDRCPSVTESVLKAMLRIELPGRLAEPNTESEGYVVAVGCTGGDVVASVTPPQGRPREVRLSLASVAADVWPRIVGLTVAEMVRDIERDPVVPVITPVVPQSTMPTVESRASGAHGAWHTGIVTEAASFGMRSPWLFGGGARVDYERGWLGGGIDAVALTGSDRLSLGSAQTVLTYFGPHVKWRLAFGRVEQELGVGCAFGAARVSGRAQAAGAMANSVSGPFAASFATESVRVTLAASLSVDLTASVGWVNASVVAQDASGSSVELSGVWTTAQLGIAWAL